MAQFVDTAAPQARTGIHTSSIALARTYVQCIALEERARHQDSELAEDLAILRADLHALWMDHLRARGIPFQDRADAARLAYAALK